MNIPKSGVILFSIVVIISIFLPVVSFDESLKDIIVTDKMGKIKYLYLSLAILIDTIIIITINMSSLTSNFIKKTSIIAISSFITIMGIKDIFSYNTKISSPGIGLYLLVISSFMILVIVVLFDD